MFERKRKSESLKRGVPLGGAFAAVVASAAVGALVAAGYSTSFRTPPGHEIAPIRSVGFHYEFWPPSPPWQRVRDWREPGFVIALHWQRIEPEAGFVLAVRKMPSSASSSEELQADAMRLLKGVLRSVEITTEKRASTELSGQKAERLVFRTSGAEGQRVGDVHILTHDGITFWLLRWCDSHYAEQCQPELDELRDRLIWLK